PQLPAPSRSGKAAGRKRAGRGSRACGSVDRGGAPSREIRIQKSEPLQALARREGAAAGVIDLGRVSFPRPARSGEARRRPTAKIRTIDLMRMPCDEGFRLAEV